MHVSTTTIYSVTLTIHHSPFTIHQSPIHPFILASNIVAAFGVLRLCHRRACQPPPIVSSLLATAEPHLPCTKYISTMSSNINRLQHQALK